jgi:DNA-binding transcriptional LysR family regulator
MPLTFRKLEVFIAAADDGSFRRAADRLGISQPSVSAQIRSIEQHLRCELFDRRRGATAALSEPGREFLARARELVKTEGELAAERNTAPRLRPAILRVSVGPILLETRIKPVLPEFHERYPNIALEFLPFDPRLEREKAIRSGALDVLMYTGGPYERTRISSETIARIPCSIYAATPMRAVDFDSAPFVLPPKHYHICAWFESQLASIGIRPGNVVARPPYMEVVRQMIVDGKGIGVLFDEHAAEYVAAGRLHALGAGPLWAWRIMALGRRALRAEMAPALRLLRSAGRNVQHAQGASHIVSQLAPA